MGRLNDLNDLITIKNERYMLIYEYAAICIAHKSIHAIIIWTTACKKTLADSEIKRNSNGCNWMETSILFPDRKKSRDLCSYL